MLFLLINPNKMLVKHILVKPLSFSQAPDFWQQAAPTFPHSPPLTREWAGFSVNIL